MANRSANAPLTNAIETATVGNGTTLTGRSADWVRYVRWTAIFLILASLISIMQSLPLDRAMAVLNGWIDGLGAWGPIVLAAIYVVATILFVPGTILTLAAGALFGLVIGTVTVSVGSTLGAACAFLIARYLARDKVASMARRNRKFGAIDRAIGEGGWKIVALLRLSPAIPFNVQNYLYGLTPVRFGPYLVTSWLAMMPGTFLYVYLGHLTGAAIGDSRQRGAAEWLMLAVGLLATAAVTVYITLLAKRKLRDQMDPPEVVDPDADETSAECGSHLPPKKVVLLSATALVLLASAIYVRSNADRIEAQWDRWLDTPRIEFQDQDANPAGTSSLSSADAGRVDSCDTLSIIFRRC